MAKAGALLPAQERIRRSTMVAPAKLLDFALPEVLEPDAYRAQNPDIASFNDDQLRVHYANHGIAEGRDANSLMTRMDFAALVPKHADALEIGPFYNPVLRSRRTRYFDVLSREELIERARVIGIAEPQVPNIDFISDIGDLSVVNQDFDVVLSSHCLEHQPDLVRHLQQVQALLRPGGRYFLLIPDKRYCFDHFIPVSTIADVIDAHHHGARTHSLRNVINHRAMTCHNEGARHWAGDHGTYADNLAARVNAALAEYVAHDGKYIDVHAWFFTPDSTTELITALRELGLIEFSIERLYPTRRESIEFWMVLRR
jgi:SAM-dependent methyltransferase